MPHQIGNTGRAPGRALVATFITLIALLTGCSHTIKAGAPLPPVAADKGDVYIYRAKSDIARGQIFYTTVDGKVGTSMSNGTYIVLNLAPGQHRITVSPGPFGFNRARTIQVVAGERSYYEFEFKPYADDKLHFEKTALLPRAAEVATADIAKLAGVKAGGNDRRPSFRRTTYAGLRDLESLPGVSDQGRIAYAKWLRAKLPRAFVIASNGAYVYTSGLAVIDVPGISDPATRAMQRCAARADVICQVYAVNTSVVWTPLPARMFDKNRKEPLEEVTVVGDDESTLAPVTQPISMPSVEAIVID